MQDRQVFLTPIGQQFAAVELAGMVIGMRLYDVLRGADPTTVTEPPGTEGLIS